MFSFDLNHLSVTVETSWGSQRRCAMNGVSRLSSGGATVECAILTGPTRAVVRGA